MSDIPRGPTITNPDDSMAQPEISILSIVGDRDSTAPAESALLAPLLSEFGVYHQLVTVADSFQAFTDLWAVSPSVLLIDWAIACPDLLAQLPLLRQQARGHGPAVIILGDNDAAIAVQAMKSGAQEYLVRDSLTSSQLVDAVQTAMNRTAEFTKSQDHDVTTVSALNSNSPLPSFPTTVEVSRNQRQAAAMTTARQEIADLQAIKSQLQDSQHFIHQVAEAVPGMLYVFDLVKQRNVYINRQIGQVLGYSREQIQDLGNQLLPALMHPDDWARVPDHWAQLQTLQDHETVEFEYRMRRADGDWRWLQAREVIFQRQANGEPEQILGIAQDITAQKQMAEIVRKHRERFQLLADNIQDVFWVADFRIPKILYVSPAYEKIWGRSPVDVYKDYSVWAATLHPDDRERVVANAARALTEDYVEQEYRILRPDGAVRWIRDRGCAVRGHTGEIEQMVGIAQDITEQKQAAETLRLSEERFRDLADNISQLTWMADPGGHIFWYSQRWYDYTGTTFEQMQGWGWRQVHHPDHVERVVKKITRCFQSGEFWEDTFPLRSHTGEYRWFLSRAVPIKDEAGNIVRWFGSNTDITKQQQSEARLADNEARLRGFVESNVVGILYGDVHGNIFKANDELLRIVGYTQADLEAGRLSWVDITPPEYLPLDEQSIGEVQATGTCTPYEKEYIRKDGQRIPVLVGFTLLGERREESVAFVLDLSARKKTEKSLRRSEDRLRIALEAGQLGTWDWNLVTNRVVWNTRFKALFGLPPQGQMTLDRFFDSIHPDDRDRIQQAVDESLAPASGGDYDVEYRIIGIEDQQERWILAKGQVYFADNGTPRRFIGTVLDITERKTATAERERLLRQEQVARVTAERANRVKDEFLAILSHELRSPLNPILGWSQLLQTKSLSPEKTTEALQIIERNAKLQTQLIDDLLDVARILRGKLKLDNAPVPLAPTVAAAMETVKTAATAKAISIHSDLPDLGNVWGDAARIQQIVWNLLSNAVKFTPKGGRVEVRVELGSGGVGEWESDGVGELGSKGVGELGSDGVGESGSREVSNTPTLLSENGSAEREAATASTPHHPITPTLREAATASTLHHSITPKPHHSEASSPDYAAITVTDTGKGIHPNFLPHIFDSFRQEDISITREHGGLGLGLAIVRHLVTAHGGEIAADSPGEGKGATFTVTLPLMAPASILDPDADGIAQPLSLQGLQLLAVDDDADSRDLLRTLLSEYGATVVTAASAKAALVQLMQHPPDVLISDIGMPQMDGLALLRRVRSLSSSVAQVPAIALTAYAREEDQQKVLEQGFQKHLPKPVDVERLVQAIVELVSMGKGVGE
jgi:PAS domain S-box-containing protein